MNDNDDSSPGAATAAPPPPDRATEQPNEPRRLYRRRDGRIAGVAGGLADYLRIDPVLVRLAFVVSIFVGGLGVIAYLVAWLVLPVEEGGLPATTARSSTANLGTVVGIILLVIAAMIGVFSFDGPFDGGVLVPLALIAGGIVLLTQRPGESLVGDAPSPPIDAGVAASPPLPVADRTDYLPPPPSTSADATTAGPPPDRHNEPKRPNYITAITLSLLSLLAAGGIAVGATDWFDITATQVLAIGLLVIGGGLVISAMLGGARGLIALGLLLTVATLLTAALEFTLGDGVGERTFVPTNVAELEDEYTLGIGELVVDLTEIDLPPGTHELRVDLGIGRALVIVPPDIGLVMTGDVSIGELDLLGEDQAGIDNTLRSSNDVDDETTLLLDLEVGIGKGEVRSE